MVRYGLIGRHLGHSFSTGFFNDKFSREGIEARYDLFEISRIEELLSLIEANPELRGLNITIPYKQEILSELPFATLTERAKAAGAINTVRIERETDRMIFHGENTDVIGFRDSLKEQLSERTDIKKALVLGAGGGAAKAVTYSLKRDFGMTVTGVSRHPEDGNISYKDLSKDLMEDHLLIINCTPLGMWPNVDECPEIPYGQITDRHMGFDLTYNPAETLFMRKINEAGGKSVNGLGMLIGQALASWEFWNE